MTKDVDVLIVGAGAAGLAALDRLENEPVDALVLEARDRVGGRAFTVTPKANLPLDLGAGWLHSADRNPLVARIAQKGFVIDRSPPHWDRDSGATEEARAERREFGRALAALEQRLAAAALTGVDRPAAELLEPAGRWNARLNAFSCYYNGASWDRISVLDYGAYEDTGVNWRVREGYGAGVAALARRDRIRLGRPVETIDHSEALLRVETAQGALTCRTAIVTAPTPQIARGLLKFRPELPEKVEAAGNLPLGWVAKAFLELLEPDALPAESHLTGRDPARTGSYNLRPFGRPYVEAFLAGQDVRDLEAEGPGALTAYAIAQLADRLGSAARTQLAPLRESAWTRDPFALGAYSYAKPGRSGARAELARPVQNRLFFAGEATHPHFFSTVHGAWESGVRAAEEALRALGLPAPPNPA